MMIHAITDSQRNEFNSVVSHPLQSFEWGEFRKKTGLVVKRFGVFEKERIRKGFQITFHRIPYTPFTIGYLAKSSLPTKEDISFLTSLGKKDRCLFIQIEPNVKKDQGAELKGRNIVPSAHPLFTKYTFQLSLEQSENDLFSNMHQKTRYNIRVAQKHGVMVKEQTDKKAFDIYLELTQQTIKRQGFYAHTTTYHKLMWETLREKGDLRAHLFIAWYKRIPLVSWILFTFHDTLYYPYGASSSMHRETMASNLMMWEAIKFGKKMNLKTFDMWGALGENPDTKDPWYGFHRFKMGYGPTLIEFLGSFDLIVEKPFYEVYKVADKFRWLYLRSRS